MDQKLLFILGAGALVYFYFNGQKQAAATASPASSGGSGSGTNAGAGTSDTGGGAATAQPEVGASGAPTRMQIMRAATNPAWAAEAGSYKLDLWTWNWYRQQYQIEVANNANPDPAIYQPTLDAFATPSIPVTAATYHAILQRAGVGQAGLGWAPALPYGHSPWVM